MSILDVKNSVTSLVQRAEQTVKTEVSQGAKTIKNEVAQATSQVKGVADAFGAAAKQTPVAQQALGNLHAPAVQGLKFPWPGKGSTGEAGWILRQPNQKPTTDGTAAFNQLNAAATSGGDVLPPDAGNYKYLVIGGLFGKHLPSYMDGQVNGLKEKGLDASQVMVDSDASVEQNAETIRQAIEAAHAEGKQVVIIGHSKGGVDAAAALSMHPELKADVRAMVAIQSPFGGSPVASDIESTPLVKPFVEGFVKNIFQGDPASVKDLTYDARKAFLQKYPLPTDVPTVSVATSHSPMGSALGSTEAYMLSRYGYKSDGLVVPDDAVMPGSEVVRLNDLDHAQSTIGATDVFSDTYKPEALTQALVAMALKLPPASTAQA